MKKLLGRLIILLIIAFIAIQFVPCERSNPPVESDLSAPEAVHAIFKRACYDCHSHETRWPLYAKVAPISWQIAEEVEEAREHLNFSKWGAIEPKKLAHVKEEIWEEIEKGKMPPSDFYLRMHSEAKLSDADKATLKAWCEAK